MADELNGLSYCSPHGRECCHDCIMESLDHTFKLPESGIPQYPNALESIADRQLRTSLGKRWLDMQQALYLSQAPTLTVDQIWLSPVEVPDEVKTSPTTLQSTLLQLLRQLQGTATAQRYYFANQSKIVFEDYDMFDRAAVLYQEELFDEYSRLPSLYQLRGKDPDASQAEIQLLKANASVLNTLGFFLHLNTQRTFWRTMELTADAFVQHVERFQEECDGQAVLTDKATGSLLQWLANVFWSLQHAQFQLDRLRIIQLKLFQKRVFPFFPYSLQALEEDDLDIHLIIAKLSKAPVQNLPQFSALFFKLRQAIAIPEQMQHINAAIMAGIDELSTRFRFLETLILAADLVTTENKIKLAMTTVKFNPRGREVNSWSDDVMEILSDGIKECDRVGVSRERSFLQNLIVKETQFRQRNVHRVMKSTFVLDDSNRFPKKMFETFKANFTALYRASIMRQRKDDEYSLLDLDVASRLQHRREFLKKEKKRAPQSDKSEKGDVGGVRSVPERLVIDPSLFWEIGDGSLEKYVPPKVRNKIKTRKQVVAPETREEALTRDEGVPSMTSAGDDARGPEDTALVQRPLGQLKHTDLVTRDILWRKVKGCLKWTNLVQFLSRLGCKILNLDGSKMKIVTHTQIVALFCTSLILVMSVARIKESYRVHIEDWLKIKYSHLVPPKDLRDSEALNDDSGKSTKSTADDT